MLTLGDAISRVLAGAAPLATERVSLGRALERLLAIDLTARVDSPPFTNSAMDGFAVRADALIGATHVSPVTLPVEGESRAGGALVPTCPPGATIRIFTGAPLPEGSDSVVLQEDVQHEGHVAVFRDPARQGQNVRQRGEDVAVGGILLPRGARLRAGDIGLLASQGIGEVEVYRRPRVAILSTGDELRRLDEPERPGSIVNSNAYMLEALVLDAGGTPDVRPIVSDTLPTLTASVREACATSDLVISTGGVSVGDHDLMRDALGAAGVSMDFWKVAIKPGKPFAFGRAPHGSAVAGLPGNPVSAFVTFEVLVRPLLRVLAGDPRPHRRHLAAKLASAVKATRGRDELLRARLTEDATSPSGLGCVPVARRGSGALPALAGVDVLARIPAGEETVPAGALVQCLPLFDVPGVARTPFPLAMG
ncbi:MAG: molybdopterin molybdotransferase MoeA [Sandaracinaceae bacterium]|nr:molybdopterin molybdotransferase MoeA [Sandaracinaceae bacterium]